MPESPPYAPLRVHGHHSLLTGVDAPAALLARAERAGLPALALCDVDSLAGVTDFLLAAGRLAAEGGGVRPIVGAELSDPSGAPGRVVALVRDARGWASLCRLVSARQLGGDPGEIDARLDGPQDFDLVEEAIARQEGLTYLVDHPRLAYALADRVPPEELFVAVGPQCLRKRRAQGRPGAPPPLAAEDRLDAPKVPPPPRAASLSDLVGSAEALGLSLVAAPDVYAATRAGGKEHRARVAVKHNALLCDLPESWVAEGPLHLPSPAGLAELYAELPAGLVARTLAVAERCAFVPALGGVLLPEVELAEGESAYSRLVQLAFDGARERYRPLRPEVVRRLDRELSAIHELGYAAYFLLVRRIAAFAWERGIPCVGRGSAADSLVAYCLRLTDADPLRYRLPFERFLNPARKDRPDIDLDFCWRRRDEVLEAVYTTFGPERTAMISTLCCFGLRAAFREAALVHGVPPAEVNQWSRRLPWAPPVSGTQPPDSEAEPHSSPAEDWGLAPPRDLANRNRVDELSATPGGIRAHHGDGTILRALRSVPECRDFPFEDERMQAVLATAESLLDTPRHFGLHPGGVVVSPGPITDFVACQRAAKGPVVTQLDKDGVEAIGLVKMDLLGNRALTVLDDCTRTLKEVGLEPDLEHPGLEDIDEDDPRTAELLVRGHTLGCFQVESPGMRNLLKQTGARTMDAVIQAVALIRPGPAGSGMKDAYVRRFRGLEDPTPPHPRLTELLWDTHGVMLYQEDVMQVAALLAGMELAEADQLRRALQKRRSEELEGLAARFREGCAETGVDARGAARVWELVCNFASFGFCKAHAVTYGRIAYRTVWLKARWPAAFLAAFLASETGYYEPRVYVEEARRLGVAILPPDVNKSGATFALEGDPARGALRIGLGQVKGLSQRTLCALLERRAEGGPFVSLPDLVERVKPARDEAEALIQCGACDSFDRTRPELVWRLHLLLGPRWRVPAEARRPDLHGDGGGSGASFDRGLYDACRETPEGRAAQRLAAARARAGGWNTPTGGWGGRGIALGNAELHPGETAPLFSEPEAPALSLPRLPDLSPREKALLEMELLGLPVAMHPVELFPDEGQGPVTPCAELDRFAGGRITVRGWLAATRRVRTAEGSWMRFLTLEDETGVAEAVMFPDVYARCGHLLVSRGPFRVTGVVENQMGACTLHAERIG